MKLSLRTIHFIFGLILLVIFPLTGWYLRYRIPHLMEESDRFRFSMRGNHIYILLSGLIHLSLGAYLKEFAAKWPGLLQSVGSILLLVSSSVVIAAFFYESKVGLDRPFILSAMVMALTGALLHSLSSLAAGSRQSE